MNQSSEDKGNDSAKEIREDPFQRKHRVLFDYLLYFTDLAVCVSSKETWDSLALTFR